VAEAGATPFSLHELDSFLWRAASSLRGYVNSEDFKNYILPLLFVKWISDTWDLEHATAVTDHGEDVAPEVEADYHRFAVPDGCHWADLMVSADPGLALQYSLDRIAAANLEKFTGIFDEAVWGNRKRLPDAVLFDLIHSLDQLILNRSVVSDEMLGATYEHMIRQFADASGKKTSGFVTPQGVVRLLTRILDFQPGETVYDPACGTGGMLIGAVNELRESGRESRALRLYGQEVSASTAAIARMNLTIHGLEDFNIVHGDTLRDPRFLEGSRLQKFDVVIANPPFSLKNWGAETWIGDPYGRAFCGVPPAGRADLAWVQHMIASMNRDTGRVGVVLPHGALFRAGAEKSIRRCLIEQDCLEAVIGLPSNLLYSTSIPVCLLIIKANKPLERRGAIIFIDASAYHTKDSYRNQIDSKDLERMLAAYRSGESEEMPARLVEHAEIARSDWDLEISRYLKAVAPDQAAVTPMLDISRSGSSLSAEVAPTHLSTQELGEICDVLAGRNRIAKDDDEDQEFRVIRAEDIRSSLTAWSDLPRSNRRKATSVEVAPGDIIGSRSGPYGRWVVVPEVYGAALASDHTVVLRGRGDVSIWYLLGFLRSPRGKELIKNTQRGAVISRVSPAELKRIPVPHCPLRPDYVDPVLKSFEEEHKRLEHGIEDLYDRFSLIYESDLSVEVAARLDALQGITASMRGMTDLGEITRIARSSYPYPIARNLHAIGNTLSLRERYHEVVHEAPETLSVILTSICAAAARETATQGQAGKRWTSATSRGGATIGVRNSMVFEVARNLMTLDGSEDIGGLGRALGDSSAPAAVLMRRILAERNRIHGDYPRTDIQFQQRLAESEGDMLRLLEALGFLARWELRHAEFVEPLEGEDHSTFFSATFRVLRGDNSDWELATYTSQSPLYRGRVYAFVDDQSLIDLYPFLLVRPCQVCGALEVYHPASFSDDEVHLKSIDRGHSQVTSDARLLGAVQAAFA
jgi:type I restriction enzyme M protein